MDFIIAEMYVVYSFDKGMSFMSGRFILAMINLKLEDIFTRCIDLRRWLDSQS